MQKINVLNFIADAIKAHLNKTKSPSLIPEVLIDLDLGAKAA